MRWQRTAFKRLRAAFRRAARAGAHAAPRPCLPCFLLLSHPCLDVAGWLSTRVCCARSLLLPPTTPLSKPDMSLALSLSRSLALSLSRSLALSRARALCAHASKQTRVKKATQEQLEKRLASLAGEGSSGCNADPLPPRHCAGPLPPPPPTDPPKVWGCPGAHACAHAW